ncbi:MAG: hypothetical protein M3N47_05740 [Chloroflexota bacterium]|nr:hypothetical protein [Chloroflexota bacterium]
MTSSSPARAAATSTPRLYRRYKRALEVAGLRPLRFHDRRHTFGTRTIVDGVDG